ncbi:MAG: HAD family hydrolase [Caldimicrobium sp.]
MKGELKLLVFDCDGVLFDSRLANKEYYNFILKQAGRKPLTIEEIEYVHMHSLDECLDYLFKDYPEMKKKAWEIAKKTPYSNFFHYINIEDGLVDFLTWAHNRLYLALCTNRTTSAEPLLKHFGLYNYFHLIRTALDYPKNNPLALQSIIDFFKVTPMETLYLGDSPVDENLALSCKVPFISYKNRTLKAIKVISNYQELKAFLLEKYLLSNIDNLLTRDDP